MGRMTLKMWLKLTIAKIGWSLFIWANNTTEDKYWKQIYEIERKRELSEQESNCNLPQVSNCYVVRDWMSAEVHEFDTLEKGKAKFDEIYNETKDEECDIQLYQILNEYNNVKQ